MRTPSALFAFIAALAVTACTSPAAGAPSAAAPLVAAVVRAATPPSAPIATPTPMPPTPDPSPSLTGDDAVYTAFIDRMGQFGSTLEPLETAASAALNANDVDAYTKQARKMRTLALVLVDWLDAHPPRPCYKQMWTLTRAGVSDLASGYAHLVKYMSGSGKQADGDKGIELLNASKESTTRASAALFSVDCPD